MIQDKAYITLLSSEDYLPAVLALKASMLSFNTQYPLVVMVTEPISINKKLIQRLKNADCIIEIVPEYQYTRNTIQNYQGMSVLNTASKINVFALKQYNKLVYIDSDTMLLENIDDLFNYPDGSMMWWEEKQEAFSGLFVLEPRNHNYRFYLNIQNSFNEFDGGILNHLWFHIKNSDAHKIPQDYLQFYFYATKNDNILSKAKVIHFCNGAKPWKDKFDDDKIIIQYNKYLEEINKW